MIWVSKIKDLQYYHNTPGEYCYCDLVLFPTDITLQAKISKVTSASTCEIHQYTPDGLTDLGDITPSFEWHTTSDGLGGYYWTAKMVYINPACANKCFILRVIVKEGATIIWDKFTEQYCIESCCIPVSRVNYQQGSFQKIVLNGDVFESYGYVVNACGRQAVAIIGYGGCLNRSNGYFYGTGTKISGNAPAWGYYHASNMYATSQTLPREIERTISRNCNTQEVSRTQKFKIQGQEFLPLWKVKDLEDCFSSEKIIVVTDSIPQLRDVILDTTTPFSLASRRNIDQKRDRYKMEFEVRECRQWQMMGCGESCATVENMTYAFVLPVTDSYYNEGGNQIGVSIEDVQIWLRSQDNTTDASIIYTSPVSSTYGVVTVSGTGYLPSAIYSGGTAYANKVNAIPITQVDTDYGSLIPVVPCSTPTIGAISSVNIVCDAITIGTISSETIDEDTYQLIQYANWVMNPGDVVVRMGGTAKIPRIDIFNTAYPIGSPAVFPNLSGEIIAVLPYNCRPRSAQYLDSNNNPSIPSGANIVLDPNGYIYYSGQVTNADSTRSEIYLTEINYNL